MILEHWIKCFLSKLFRIIFVCDCSMVVVFPSAFVWFPLHNPSHVFLFVIGHNPLRSIMHDLKTPRIIIPMKNKKDTKHYGYLRPRLFIKYFSALGNVVAIVGISSWGKLYGFSDSPPVQQTHIHQPPPLSHTHTVAHRETHRHTHTQIHSEENIHWQTKNQRHTLTEEQPSSFSLWQTNTNTRHLRNLDPHTNRDTHRETEKPTTHTQKHTREVDIHPRA